jgi:predicted RNA-binding Zn ribbon-like protein
MVRHPTQDWHIHATSPEDPLAVRLAVDAAMAMADVVRADEMSRLGICADDDCDGIVLDLSRNRSRRYCSTLCSNRNAVAAYRARSSQGS